MQSLDAAGLVLARKVTIYARLQFILGPPAAALLPLDPWIAMTASPRQHHKRPFRRICLAGKVDYPSSPTPSSKLPSFSVKRLLFPMFGLFLASRLFEFASILVLALG
jgi:hypothetical protein